jgi:hypothetical protein
MRKFFLPLLLVAFLGTGGGAIAAAQHGATPLAGTSTHVLADDGTPPSDGCQTGDGFGWD